MSDPNLHWDGTKWLRWNGSEWVDAEEASHPPPEVVASAAPVAGSSTGLKIAIGILAAVLVAVLAGAGIFWFLIRGNDKQVVSGQPPANSIVTVPFDGTQDSFTDPVGNGRKVTAKTVSQPVTVSGDERGLFGGTKNESSCDRDKLVAYLTANPEKGRAWASVLGITYEQIPDYVSQLTPMLLRSDTLVTNHGFKDGQVTSFPSVLQAGTAVLAGRRGLPVVRCYCGNPLTPPPAQPAGVTYIGPTWPGWNPQSITVIEKNTTLIDIFIVVDVDTGDEFTRPAGTDGSQDGTQGATTPKPTQTTSGTQQQIEDVAGFLNAVMAGDYGAADSYTTSGFRSKYSGASQLAPGWGALQDFEIDGATIGDTFVAVYVQEYWEGGLRQSTYYVTKTGGTYIEDADFIDTPGWEESPEEYPSDYPEQYPDEYPSDYPDQYPDEYPSDYPDQYPDEGGYYDDSVG